MENRTGFSIRFELAINFTRMDHGFYSDISVNICK